MQPNCSKSTESIYSTTSSKCSASAAYARPSNFHMRKTAGILNGNVGSRSGEVRQRVLSAKRLRLKTLQNQLADAQLHIAELAQENRILRTLDKRQANALSKYENTNAELPQLLHSHAEEIRVWQKKYKNLQNQNKELAMRLKQKDDILLNLSDQNKHLTQLNNDKNLEERERLTERLNYLEQKLNEKENEMKLMARKLQLEKKSFKNQLQSEHSKYKDLLTRLEKTKTELTGLTKLDPLGIADKLAKVSILPKPIKSKERIMDYKNNDRAPVINEILDEHNFTLNKMGSKKTTNESIKEKPNCKTNIHKQRNRSLSPRSERDTEISTPSPITMRRKSSLDRKKPCNDKQIKRKTIENAFEMNIESLKSEYDDVSVISSKLNAKEYSRWRDDASDLQNEINDEYENDNYKEYDYKNSFENDENNEDDLIYNGYGDADYNEEADIDTSNYVSKGNKDLTDIKKQIMDDYEDREKFLDTFCRDSSSDALNYINHDLKKSNNVDSKKKNKLLAALKAIDENGSKDST
ncbi:lebercilin-like protein isoform X2 [Condylostylus longicornis]|uniref:lebercilin-like protein isoform X2 n=1 Tax=Condylostylus longicornis TaxID=2530218 RepID=UPI00244DD67A|nr:lebercilin-like protein isoform X2 [Condylostylus longicornis]